jgi:hypothetical protein
MRISSSAALLALTLLAACRGSGGAFPGCPEEGEAISRRVRALNRLENRGATPTGADLDPDVTLDALLAPGDDRGRWDERRAARIVGYVRAVQVGGVETVNCLARDPDHRDTHIELVRDPVDRDALPVIVEVTPSWRTRAGVGAWSTDSLRASLLGRWVRVTGWLLFDGEHSAHAENTAPGRAGNWRQTAWEIHPVSALEAIAAPDGVQP